jgi:hypothetical protein
LTRKSRLIDRDVRDLVFNAIEIIDDVQIEIDLPISPYIMYTWERLRFGTFKAMNLSKKNNNDFNMDFGVFIPPKTIILDCNLPEIDKPLNMPELANTLTMYTVVHEVIHADDYTEGNSLLLKTREHILNVHEDKLKKGMSVINQQGGSDCIRNQDDLASLWAMQYVDVVTHYRSYVVLRQKKYPKLELVWSRLREEHFPPNLLTSIERHQDKNYIFNLFNKKKGDYCFIEAFQEYRDIKENQVCTYTV